MLEWTGMKKLVSNARYGKRVGIPTKLPKLSGDFSEKVLYIIAVISGLGLFASIVGAIGLIFVFTAFSSTLPSPGKLTNRSIEQSTKIYDRNGELLYSVFDAKNRTLVTLSQVSPYLIHATLATEDGDFYYHQGIDPLGTARGILVTITTRGKQGGSTLTQQVAKNALLTQDRTITRKIKDIVLALQIEKKYSKDEILQMYLNEVPYGGTTWGVEAASKTYFGKSAADLTLAESALIAGLPQSPTRYSPFRDPEAAKDRQKYVLYLMHTRGWVSPDGSRQYISDEEYNKAIEEPLNYASFNGTFRAPHFVMYVLNLLRERYGDAMVESGGLQVKTSLDLKIYDEYQNIVKEEVEKAKNLDVSNAGLVAIDPKTREILAMVGSVDYFSEDIDGQFNVALGKRQPGSTLKPITYLTGFLQGYTASTVMYDVYTQFDGGAGQAPYDPQNYGGWGFRGPIQVRYALANSVNVTAVKMLDLVGIQNMVNLANNLGVKSLYYDPSKHGLALTLGGGEVTLLDLTSGYASLAAEGVYKDSVAVLEVKDGSGKVLEHHQDSEGKRVVDPRYVYVISTILSDNNARAAAFGTGSQLYIPNNKVAVKTGTSNDLKDNWTVGYTDEIAIGVWVGNNDGKQMNNRLASGLTGAAPIWHRAIVSFLTEHPHKEFKQPEGIKEVMVGTLSGMLPYEDKEEQRLEYFVEGTEPKTKSDMFQRVKICDDGDVEDKLYIEYKAEKPEWQKYVDAWIDDKYKDNDDERYKYRGPEVEKKDKPDKFDTDNCEEDDDD